MGAINSISDMLAQMEKFKEELIDLVAATPDNPKINRISEKPNVFTISFSNTGGNLSPEFHDSRYQAQVIIDLIQRQDNLVTIQNILKKIVSVGKYQLSPGYMVSFNSQVRKYIEKLL